MSEDKIGNIGEEEYQECVRYFQTYWGFFVERNPDMDSEEWMDIYFMVFLSGFSAGINVGETIKKNLIEEIIQSN